MTPDHDGAVFPRPGHACALFPGGDCILASRRTITPVTVLKLIWSEMSLRHRLV